MLAEWSAPSPEPDGQPTQRQAQQVPASAAFLHAAGSGQPPQGCAAAAACLARPMAGRAALHSRLRPPALPAALFGLLMLPVVAQAEPLKQDIVIFREPGKYAAFPNLWYDAANRLWVWFSWNTTRSHYGRHAGGQFGSWRFFSPDMGRTWIRQDRPGFQPLPPDVHSVRLSDGTLVRVGALMWEQVSEEKARRLEAAGKVVRRLRSGRIVASYRYYAAISTDGGKTWKRRYFEPDVALIAASPARPIALPDDTIICPVYGYLKKGEPLSAWALLSRDRGRTWQLIVAARDGIHGFGEWSVVYAGQGRRVVGLIRTEGGDNNHAPLYDRGFLYQVVSEDGGLTWSKPARTPLWGYPAYLIRLRDGSLLATYGYRRPPYGIRACFSRDGGRSWQWRDEVILRDDALPHGYSGIAHKGDLGYPRTVELRDGTLFTVYYITLGDDVTHIAATRWSRDFVGPRHWPRGRDAAPPPDPSLPPRHIVGETRWGIRLLYAVHQSFIPVADRVAAVAIRLSERSRHYRHDHGIFVVLRRPSEATWYTPAIAKTSTIPASELPAGGWALFKFPKPAEVVPGEPYVLTVYNADYQDPKTRSQRARQRYAWILNGGLPDYPNGGIGAGTPEDIAFAVYAEAPAAPPKDPAAAPEPLRGGRLLPQRLLSRAR